MNPRTFVIAAAFLVAVVAVMLLAINVSATTSGGQSIACGNGFKTDTNQAAQAERVDDLSNAMMADSGYSGYLAAGSSYKGFAQACDSALSIRRTWSFVLLGIAAVALLGGLVVRQDPRPASPAAG